jgi:hypothetical protein
VASEDAERLDIGRVTSPVVTPSDTALRSPLI